MQIPNGAVLSGLVLSSVVVAGVLLAQESKEQPRSPRASSVFMRQKLVYSQRVLEGLTLENYDLIVTNGIRMWNMSNSNVWQVIFNDEYNAKSAEFRGKVMTMIDAARDKNLAAAQDAYAETIRSCYDCHKTFYVSRRLNRRQAE